MPLPLPSLTAALTVLLLNAPTSTPGRATSGRTPAPTPRRPSTPASSIWVNETSPAHEAALAAMAADFGASSGIQVEMVQVSPRLLPDLVQTAVLSGTLPDLILHPMEFTMGWTDAGILNPTRPRRCWRRWARTPLRRRRWRR